MAKSDDFIMPLLHKEFTSATSDWTDAEVGAYIRLLIVQWDQGSIPEDLNRIRRIADSIDQTGLIVLQKFQKSEQVGRLQNLKMEEIREERKIFRAKKSDSGKEGAAKRWQTNSKHNSKIYSKHIAFSNEVEVEVEVDNEIKLEKSKIPKNLPPSLQEALQQFSLSRPDHWSISYMEKEAHTWFDHYTANGWRVGKNKMKDWKATIRTWIRNDYNFSKNGTHNNGKRTDKDGNTILAGRITESGAASLLAAAELYERGKNNADGDAGTKVY